MNQQQTCDRCPAPATRFTAIPVKIGGAVMWWNEHAYCATCDPFDGIGVAVKDQRRNSGRTETMRVKGVSFAELAAVAAMHNMTAITASGRPGWTGVCLRPVGAFWRRVSPRSERRVNAVCWHGHARFLRELFDRFPDAVVETSFPVRASAFGDQHSYDRIVGRHRIVAGGPSGDPLMSETPAPALVGTIGYWGLADWLDYTRDADIGSTFYPYTPVDLCRHDDDDMKRYQTRVGALRSAPEGVIING